MSSPVLADHFTILSDTIRVRMLVVLEGRELTVSELCDITQSPQSTVSRHLKTLSDGGWITSRPDGTRRLYTFPLEELSASIQRLWDAIRDEVASSATSSEDDRRLKLVLANRRTQSEAFFSSAAGQWDKLREDLFGATSHLRALAGLLEPGTTVGDLGCGTGKISEWVGLFADRVIAVDSSREMLEAARTHLASYKNIQLRQGSLEKLPIEDEELDVALMMLVLHHLPEPKRVLVEAARTLKPGGRLLVLDMVSHEHEEYRQTMGHVWLGFDEKQMTRWLHAARFRMIRSHILPPESKTKGPSLFVATARRA
jgi:ArsR family transcriptional regulator